MEVNNTLTPLNVGTTGTKILDQELIVTIKKIQTKKNDKKRHKKKRKIILAYAIQEGERIYHKSPTSGNTYPATSKVLQIKQENGTITIETEHSFYEVMY